MDLLQDPQIAALIRARHNLHDATATMMTSLPLGDHVMRCGTRELPAAIAAMEAAEDSGALHEIEDAARWMARAVTITPSESLAMKMGDTLAFLGAVILVRGALAQLDEAKAMGS